MMRSIRSRLPVAHVGVVLSAWAWGCTCGDQTQNSDALPDLGQDADIGLSDALRLEIEPSSVDLAVDGLTPKSQSFVVTLVLKDGQTRDVTNEASLSLANADLGTLTGAVFTSRLTGGESDLVATLGAHSAISKIRVTVSLIVIVPPAGSGPAVPQNPDDVFTRAPIDASRAPRIVYPNDGVLLPPNLGKLELHYRRGDRANTLFEITLSSPNATSTVYTRCVSLGAGCLYLPDASVWSLLATTNRGGEAIVIRVRATDDAGTGVGSSGEIRVLFAAVPVAGGLYYWTTSNGTGIMRIDFGAAALTPERFFPFNGGGCYGCHSLSRNGRRMSLSENGIGDGRLTLLDVASRTVVLTGDANQREQFQTWNPSSDRFAAIFADGSGVDAHAIRIRDGNTGQVVDTVAIDGEPDHPDWSPAGDRMLFTFVTRHQNSQRPGRGGISFIEQMAPGSGTSGWSARRELIAPEDGVNRYYPAFSPDAQFFVYDESRCPSGEIYDDICDGDADPSATLWARDLGSGPRIPLTKANAPGIEDNGASQLSNTFPKWAPFVDARSRDGTGRLMWLTFSSRRQYGLRSPSGTNQLIWMVALDPDEVAAGRDGSYPAFALPFQDLDTSNHIAQWTTRIIPPPPPGGGGDGGVDQPNPGVDAGMCLDVGETCNPVGEPRCCSGSMCAMNGPGIYLCRPAF